MAADPLLWVDTHCHVISPVQATPPVPGLGVVSHTVHAVLAATSAADFDAVRQMAHASGSSYALGIHPWSVEQSNDEELAADLARLASALQQNDPRLVAVGEIGLDGVASSSVPCARRDRQNDVYVKQLDMARRYHLPVILHSRGAVDLVLAGLRRVSHPAWCGVAHAFNGSLQQARALMGLGIKLGFGRAFAHDRALHLRRLATHLPLSAIVLETDASDSSTTGSVRRIDSRMDIPSIGAELAALRSIHVTDLAQATTHNARTALPKITLSQS